MSYIHPPGIGRVAILDFDVHHGNGTQAVVANTQPSTQKVAIKTPFSEGVQVFPTYKPWLDMSDADNIFFARCAHELGIRQAHACTATLKANYDPSLMLPLYSILTYRFKSCSCALQSSALCSFPISHEFLFTGHSRLKHKHKLKVLCLLCSTLMLSPKLNTLDSHRLLPSVQGYGKHNFGGWFYPGSGATEDTRPNANAPPPQAAGTERTYAAQRQDRTTTGCQIRSSTCVCLCVCCENTCPVVVPQTVVMCHNSMPDPSSKAGRSCQIAAQNGQRHRFNAFIISVAMLSALSCMLRFCHARA
eukprot:1159402-Pelagomonas_calceolata.AAC.10